MDNQGKELAKKIEQSKLKQSNLNMGRTSSNINDFSSLSQPEESLINDEILEENYEQEVGNSGIKPGLLSPLKKQEKKAENITDLGKKIVKAKKTLKIVGIISIASLLIFSVLAVVIVVMSQIMAVRDSIQALAEKFTTGVEKIVNFAQGDGWMTNEDAFFNYLDEQYNNFEDLRSEGEELDIPLIAATIHYSTTIDLEQYEENIGTEDEEYNVDDFEQIGSILSKDQTVSFYRVAREKVGSVSSIFPGQKRLLGHLSNVELEPGFYNYESSKAYWNDFFNLALDITTSTGMDIKDETILGWAVHPITSFIALYQEMEYYLSEYDDITYGMRYDAANNKYELEEFLFKFSKTFEEAQKTGDGVSNDAGMFFSIKISTSMNYGYDEYKQMKKDMLEMKSILRKSGITTNSEEEVLEYAENSSDVNLKSYYDSYKKAEETYLYSYTHYLKELYIPFTYFYNQEYTDTQIDIIIEEIYDQRDFFNYLIEHNESNIVCGDGTQAEEIVEYSEEKFIDFMGPLARFEYSKNNVLASVTIAHAIMETNYGKSIALNSNNLFNISCNRSNANCVLVESEDDIDSTRRVKAYETLEDSIEEHSKILKKYEGLTDTIDYKEQIRILSENDINIDEEYAEKLIEIIEKRNLTKYDQIVDTTSGSLTCVVGDYANWKQYDKQWGSVLMSNSGSTIQNIGCLVTSIAIQIARSGVPIQNIDGEFNPGTFVPVLRRKGIIGSSGNLGSFNMTYVAPDFHFVGQVWLNGYTKTQKAQKIAGLLEEGYYPVIEVWKSCPDAGQHWVAIDRVEGDTVYMFDPGSPATVLWDEYRHECNSRVAYYKVN